MSALTPRERVAFWTKDGAYHVLQPHTPSEADRARFPVSYPPGDAGPFYQWTADAFDSEAEALAALEGVADAS